MANLRYQIIPNYLVILFHRRSTTVSLETYPLYPFKLSTWTITRPLILTNACHLFDISLLTASPTNFCCYQAYQFHQLHELQKQKTYFVLSTYIENEQSFILSKVRRVIPKNQRKKQIDVSVRRTLGSKAHENESHSKSSARCAELQTTDQVSDPDVSTKSTTFSLSWGPHVFHIVMPLKLNRRHWGGQKHLKLSTAYLLLRDTPLSWSF